MSLSSLSSLTFFRGRVALCAILKALGIGQGDEVAIQAFTCIAVPEGIMATGASPLYIDVEPTGFNMDAADLAKKITPQTKAIVVQHTFGIPADMDRIVEIAEQRKIPIIEDCCHTLVSTYKGKRVGSFGVGSFYSFEWGKPIVAGIGGSAIINDPALGNNIKAQYVNYRPPPLSRQFRLRLQYIIHQAIYKPALFWPVRSAYKKLAALGMAEGNFNPIQEEEGDDFTLKMSKHTQKILGEKLKRLEEHTKHSKWVASEYRSRINSSLVSQIKMPDYADITFARYPLITHEKDNLLKQACKVNVELADWYKSPVHPLEKDQWHLVHYEASSCPNAETFAKQIVTLPTNLKVKKGDVDRAVRFFNNLSI